MILQIGWRNLWRNPRRTATILTAIVVGIISMVILSAFGRGVMEGMVNNAINNLVGHIKITDAQYRIDPDIENRINDVEGVFSELDRVLGKNSSVVRRLRLEGMLSTSRDNVGVEVVGIEPGKEIGMSFIGRPVLSGTSLEGGDDGGLLIGQALMERLGLEVGKKVVLLCRDGEGENSSRAFRIRGSYRTELRDTEKRFVFVNLGILQNMTGVGSDVTEISVRVDDGDAFGTQRIAELSAEIDRRVAGLGLETLSWEEQLPPIRAYVEMFDVYMLIWFVVVFIAMGFGLANTVLMAVYERMREFGLQRALGMRSSGIVRVVMVEVLLLLLLGIFLANGISFVLIQVVFEAGIDLSLFGEGVDMFGFDRIIYPILTIKDIVMSNGVVMILGLVVGLYPALHAARFTPVETMRHL